MIFYCIKKQREADSTSKENWDVQGWRFIGIESAKSNRVLQSELAKTHWELYMDGVSLKQFDEYALCCVEALSDELKAALRDNLSRICHGVEQASQNREMYKYTATIKSFWCRYSEKTPKTKMGMLGELLSHVIILKLFTQFEVVSPFFNLEEKSIKKGFDILLYDSSQKNVWITEVKSGEIHKNKTTCGTTLDLLSKARDDLKKRLAEQELNHWQNAIHAARIAIKSKADYRDLVIDILETEGDLVVKNSANSQDNNVFLVSTLFSDVTQQVAETTISKFTSELAGKSLFKSIFVLSLHKGTLKKLEDFLKAEAGY